MTRYDTYLPTAPELIDMYGDGTGGTQEKIGKQYGVSRQAVHKRMDKWTRETYGVGFKEYRKLKKEGKLPEKKLQPA